MWAWNMMTEAGKLAPASLKPGATAAAKAAQPRKPGAKKKKKPAR